MLKYGGNREEELVVSNAECSLSQTKQVRVLLKSLYSRERPDTDIRRS